eukprot:GHVU01105343.1.p1 GENE.GHVU01105343.1~~GHVU01105343.1.p1  ORF type:complete len:668 (+),score=142.85 GHVU01105343.1:1381-3384(+)
MLPIHLKQSSTPVPAAAAGGEAGGGGGGGGKKWKKKRVRWAGAGSGRRQRNCLKYCQSMDGRQAVTGVIFTLMALLLMAHWLFFLKEQAQAAAYFDNMLQTDGDVELMNGRGLGVAGGSAMQRSNLEPQRVLAAARASLTAYADLVAQVDLGLSDKTISGIAVAIASDYTDLRDTVARSFLPAPSGEGGQQPDRGTEDIPLVEGGPAAAAAAAAEGGTPSPPFVSSDPSLLTSLLKQTYLPGSVALVVRVGSSHVSKEELFRILSTFGSEFVAAPPSAAPDTFEIRIGNTVPPSIQSERERQQPQQEKETTNQPLQPSGEVAGAAAAPLAPPQQEAGSGGTGQPAMPEGPLKPRTAAPPRPSRAAMIVHYVQEEEKATPQQPSSLSEDAGLQAQSASKPDDASSIQTSNNSTDSFNDGSSSIGESTAAGNAPEHSVDNSSQPSAAAAGGSQQPQPTQQEEQQRQKEEIDYYNLTAQSSIHALEPRPPSWVLVSKQSDYFHPHLLEYIWKIHFHKENAEAVVVSVGPAVGPIGQTEKDLEGLLKQLPAPGAPGLSLDEKAFASVPEFIAPPPEPALPLPGSTSETIGGGPTGTPNANAAEADMPQNGNASVDNNTPSSSPSSDKPDSQGPQTEQQQPMNPAEEKVGKVFLDQPGRRAGGTHSSARHVR